MKHIRYGSPCAGLVIGASSVDATSERVVIEFDHTSPEYAAQAGAITADLRARCPVAYSESHDGFWVDHRLREPCPVHA